MIKYGIGSIFVVVSTTLSTSAQEQSFISIRGLSVGSSVTIIESVFGACGPTDERGFHYCGESEINSYRLDSSGNVSEIWFDCMHINACTTPITALSDIIAEAHSNIVHVDMDIHASGGFARFYGSAGDLLELMTFQSDLTETVGVLKMGDQIRLD